MGTSEHAACNQDNISKRIEALFSKHGESVEIGRTLGIFSKGWLSISDRGDFWDILYTSSKDTHSYQPLYGPALGADFLKASGERKIGPRDLTGAWKTALSLWPVRDEREAVAVFETVKGYIERAYTNSFK
jgi:hypothetical protein